jgi:hypothetical protein
MAGSTDHYGLSTLTGGDSLSQDGYKYTDADRSTIDMVLYQGAEGHVHTGAAASVLEPDTAPTLTLETTGGFLPAGTRVYYKYTYVSPQGGETIASPESFVDTPLAIADPSAPVISYTETGGVLPAGNYFYVLSSYISVSTNETKATAASFITIPATTGTNEITLTLPDPDPYQTGFIVYRRKPGQSRYFYLATVPTDVATPPTTYVDDGSVEEDCDRTLPVANTTNATSSITVSIPGATPVVPEGYTWKIYRTYVNGTWTRSFLTHITETTVIGGTFAVTDYLDVGLSTSDGTFPDVSLALAQPSKIDLTDGANVQGTLPMGMVSGFVHAQELFFPGTLTVGAGEAEWICPFTEAVVIHAVAALGRGSAPSSDDVIADVVIGKGDPPVFTSVYLTQGAMPTIAVGDNKTVSAATANGTLINRTLSQGDVLSADIIQDGGGASPTDVDLSVVVLMYVQAGALTSIDWDA